MIVRLQEEKAEKVVKAVKEAKLDLERARKHPSPDQSEQDSRYE